MLATQLKELETKKEWDDDYLSPEQKAEFDRRLEAIKNGTAVLYTRQELEKRLNDTINKYK